jgi:hypothetical protein
VKKKLYSNCFLILLTFALTACGGGSDDSAPIAENASPIVENASPIVENASPTADAGIVQTVNEQAIVTLDGTASSDVEDDGNSVVLTYTWSRTDINVEEITLNNYSINQPTFMAPDVTENTTFTFELTVTDSGGGSSTDIVAITVQPIVTATHPLNDTGITTCSDDSNNGLGCPVAGFEGQDAEHGRDVSHNDDTDGHGGFDFTKLDANGNALASSATDWSCVQDNVTNLVWEVKTKDYDYVYDLRDTNNTYTWYNSTGVNDGGSAGTENGGLCSDGVNCDTEKYTAQVNHQGLCGASDWHLPSKEELLSIVDYSRENPAIDTLYFPHTKNSKYWSSSPFADGNSYAWYVNFFTGNADSFNKYYQYVRLVRGGQ